MASSNTVKVDEVTQVRPSCSNSSPTDISLPLTLYDAFWFKFPPVERLFFYQFSHLTPHVFHSDILPKLKNSLSLTLRHYLPLAGNLIWPPDAPKPAIYHSTNDGVYVTVAESSSDFNFLSDDGIIEADLLRPLIPELLISDDKAATIALQITLFPNQGFCIGTSTHHAILDGRSYTTFIKSWADLCKQLVEGEEHPLLSHELTPSFDRTVIKDPTGIDVVYVNNWLDYMTGSDWNPSSRSLKVLPAVGMKTNLVRATYELTREDIKKLRSKVLSILDEQKESKQLHLSSFVVTCAYVFVCMVKAKGGGGDGRSVLFAFTADYRTRLDPPVPTNYFGNCVMTHIMSAKAKDFTDEYGIAFVSEKLSETVKGLENGVLEGTEESLLKLMRIMSSVDKVHAVGIAGSIQFDVYGSDFGWGRPKKVEIVSIDRTGANSLAPSRDGGGGVEVGVALGKQEMEIFASLFTNGLKDKDLP